MHRTLVLPPPQGQRARQRVCVWGVPKGSAPCLLPEVPPAFCSVSLPGPACSISCFSSAEQLVLTSAQFSGPFVGLGPGGFLPSPCSVSLCLAPSLSDQLLYLGTEGCPPCPGITQLLLDSFLGSPGSLPGSLGVGAAGGQWAGCCARPSRHRREAEGVGGRVSRWA